MKLLALLGGLLLVALIILGVWVVVRWVTLRAEEIERRY
jgi:hypothetical protein